MTSSTLDGTTVYVYGTGVVALSACAPAAMPPGEVAAAANRQQPTGISSPWRVSGEPRFAGGQPNPCPCDQQPAARLHYLLEC
jgi:hypothetical protein